MRWLRPYLISRCRVAALHAMVEAGGQPTSAQLRRAIEPVLGDLLPLPGSPPADEEARTAAAARFAAIEAEELRRDLLR